MGRCRYDFPSHQEGAEYLVIGLYPSTTIECLLPLGLE